MENPTPYKGNLTSKGRGRGKGRTKKNKSGTGRGRGGQGGKGKVPVPVSSEIKIGLANILTNPNLRSFMVPHVKQARKQSLSVPIMQLSKGIRNAIVRQNNINDNNRRWTLTQRGYPYRKTTLGSRTKGPIINGLFNSSKSVAEVYHRHNYGSGKYHKYIGNYKNGKYHGKGTYITPSKIYIGMFKNGRLNGKGALIDRTNKVKLQGKFKPINENDIAAYPIPKSLRKTFLDRHKVVGDYVKTFSGGQKIKRSTFSRGQPVWRV